MLELPELWSNFCDEMHEIADQSVPIYTSEIKGLWFLYSSEFEEAYENHGFGDNPMENDGMVAIFCYIYDKLGEKYSDENEDAFVEWHEDRFGMSFDERQAELAKETNTNSGEAT